MKIGDYWVGWSEHFGLVIHDTTAPLDGVHVFLWVVAHDRAHKFDRDIARQHTKDVPVEKRGPVLETVSPHIEKFKLFLQAHRAAQRAELEVIKSVRSDRFDVIGPTASGHPVVQSPRAALPVTPARDLERDVQVVREFLAQFEVKWVYHFTDISNLPSIRRHGLLSQSELKARGIVPARPGGDANSQNSDLWKGLGSYVHLCFKPEHPMEFVASSTGRIGPTRFLAVSSDVLLRPGTRGCVKLVNSSGAEILPLAAVLSNVDTEILFGRPTGVDRQSLAQRWNAAVKTELLVPGAISTDLMRNLD